MAEPLVPASGRAAALSPVHLRRLRDIWRSAGWPCRDNIELDLLASGLLSRRFDPEGRETLQLSDAGLALLAAKRQRHQAALSAHEALVQRVAHHQQQAGRLVWCGLSLRAPLALATPPGPALEGPTPQGPPPQGPPSPATTWAIAMPDVYSIRHTTVEAYTEPMAFEIKVSRADLLSDLRRPAKAAAYRALASQCWYVLRRGIAQVDEIPPLYGVMLADDEGLDVARPAPARAMKLPFSVWMALARATAQAPPADDPQTLI